MRLKRMGLDIVDCDSGWGMVSSRKAWCGDVWDGEGVMFEYVIALVGPRLNQAAKLHHQLSNQRQGGTRPPAEIARLAACLGREKIGDLTDPLGSRVAFV